jgi:hypothetical protein
VGDEPIPEEEVVAGSEVVALNVSLSPLPKAVARLSWVLPKLGLELEPSLAKEAPLQE